MAERLSDLETQIENMGELSSVVSAYRGIAAARLNDAQQRLDGIRSYAATVAEAIGQVLGLVRQDAGLAPFRPDLATHLVIVLCSEQGFVANFNNRVLDEAERFLQSGAVARHRLLVVGDRGLSLAEERGLTVQWTAPMAAHAEEVIPLGNRLAEALFDELKDPTVSLATIVHAVPGQREQQVLARPLIPFDFERFAPIRRPVPPLLTLPLEDLVSQLAEEYVFAELCEAIMLSYAAENEMRMMAMLSARNNVSERLDELNASARRVRQEEITAEITELAAGVEAGGGIDQ